MIKHHSFDIETSKQVYKSLEGVIQPKRCYNNIFDTVTANGSKFANDTWKIAYGYIQMIEGEPFMARHCFIVDEKGNAIDPTLIATNGFEEMKDYKHTSYTILKLVEYLHFIDKNDQNPDMMDVFRKLESKTIVPWALKNKIILMG